MLRILGPDIAPLKAKEGAHLFEWDLDKTLSKGLWDSNHIGHLRPINFAWS